MKGAKLATRFTVFVNFKAPEHDLQTKGRLIKQICQTDHRYVIIYEVFVSSWETNARRIHHRRGEVQLLKNRTRNRSRLRCCLG